RADRVVERVLSDRCAAVGRERGDVQQGADLVPGQAILACTTDLPADLGPGRQLDLAGDSQRRGGGEEPCRVRAGRDYQCPKLARSAPLQRLRPRLSPAQPSREPPVFASLPARADIQGRVSRRSRETVPVPWS